MGARLRTGRSWQCHRRGLVLARYSTSQFLQYKDLAPPTRASLSYTLVSAQSNQLIYQVIEEKCFFEQRRNVNRNKIHQIVINKNDDFRPIKMYFDSFWINRNIGEFKNIESRLSSWTLPSSIFLYFVVLLYILNQMYFHRWQQ